VNQLELLVFDVGHGLSVALIERPENYVTLFDLGADTGFTPLKHLSLQSKLKPDVLYITHPHADHLADVETALEDKFRPLGLHFQVYDWGDVRKREIADLAYKVDDFVKLQKKVPFRSYGGNASLNYWRYTPAEAKKNFGDLAYVNNSSLFFVYKWKDFKVAIAGDQESAAMAGIVGTKAVQDAAGSTDIFIPSHHGHTNGFPVKWVEKMGKPFVSIISVQERDESVDARYFSPNFAKGIRFGGVTRYGLTTRSDGNIRATMYYNDDKPTWKFESF
jgi:hypothetical protein